MAITCLSPVSVHWSFTGAYCLHLQSKRVSKQAVSKKHTGSWTVFLSMKKEAMPSSETSLNYRTTHHIPKDNTLHISLCFNKLQQNNITDTARFPTTRPMQICSWSTQYDTFKCKRYFVVLNVSFLRLQWICLAPWVLMFFMFIYFLQNVCTSTCTLS
jgi:hypothetical protein